MRIVDICEFYAPEGGGVRTYVHAKLRAAAAAGHDMTIVAPGAADHVAVWPDGGRIITLKSPPLPFDRRYGMFWNTAPVHALLDDLQPDVLEASSPWRGAWVAASWRGNAVRSLFMHHDPLSAFAYRWFDAMAPREAIDRQFAWFWRYLQRMCAQYDTIVCAAPSLSARLKQGGIERTVTLPMGVDAGVFSPDLRDDDIRAGLLALCNLRRDATLALAVGRHTPEKRWPLVIDACTRVAADHPLGLVLIGDGHQRGKTLAHIGDNPHVYAMAPVRDRPLLARILASGDLLLHGSAAETFGLVAAEAGASGLPLVLPDMGAAHDLAHDDHCETYTAGDRKSAADAIRRMLGRDQTALRAAAAARATSARTLDEHFAELFAHYQTASRWPQGIAA
ncbi:glycosyltransferase [Blastomonas aquatica]|uniref:Glycosyl transferase family 1 n=1 Tax=Blastomonas aquatica TaxID=1510276 RepID=A0ABQ1J860_9SPHN|nr:glycosyltransferase [Blastomonas aquatica]GGB62366.1 glycosyl transferase family 1 [Blastomonas aquatica]